MNTLRLGTPISLIGHRANPFRVTARLEIPPGEAKTNWKLRFEIEGPISDLIIPTPMSARERPLWEQCCGEIFLANSQDTPYVEFNFSPAGAYNFFCFSDYRRRLEDLRLDQAPVCFWKPHPTQSRIVFDVEFQVPHVFAPNTGSPNIWPNIWDEVQVTMILEHSPKQSHGNQAHSDQTQVEYFALAQAPIKADFHWRGGFFQLNRESQK